MTSPACGCKIVNVWLTPTTDGTEIEYCPLHANAVRMLKAAELVLKEEWYLDFKPLREAIAAAQGEITK